MVRAEFGSGERPRVWVSEKEGEVMGLLVLLVIVFLVAVAAGFGWRVSHGRH